MTDTMTMEKYDRAFELRCRGWSWNDLAGEFGVHWSTVRRAVRRRERKAFLAQRTSLILRAWLNSPRLAAAMAERYSGFMLDEWSRLRGGMAGGDAGPGGEQRRERSVRDEQESSSEGGIGVEMGDPERAGPLHPPQPQRETCR